MVWAKIKGRAWCNRSHDKKKRKRDFGALKQESVREKFEKTVKEKMGEDISWETFKMAVSEAIEETCPISKQAKKPWIDDTCWKLIEERREIRQRNPHSAEHHAASRKVKNALRKAKRKWYKDRLQEAEEAHQRGDSKTVYKTIKKVTKKKSAQPGIGIKDANGEMLYNTEDICRRWKEYCAGLFSRPGLTQQDMQKGEEEPEVLESEIRAAIKKLKTGKAVGMDEIPAEALQAGGSTTVKAMKRIIDIIWQRGTWPEDWIMSELVLLPKVPGTQDCTKYRTISLISHASKILLEIIRQRLQYYLRPEIAEEQFGFTSGKGTTDAILAVRNVIQKVAKRQDEEELWLLFVDYSKAFDSVFHDALWKTLKEFGVPQHLIWLLNKLYCNAKGVVRVQDQKTEPFRFEKGVRQGCLISPLLFNTAGEKIMREVNSSLPERTGKIIGGQAIWNIRYADDTTLIASNREEIMAAAESLRQSSLGMGLHINSSKTSSMTVHGNGAIKIQNDPIENVSKFKFLGSYITPDGDSCTDMKIRFGQARNIAASLTDVWKSHDISLKLKVKLAKALVWSIALYGCESWTLRKTEQNMIQVFELWLWRRVLRVSWTERRTNEWIRAKVGIAAEQGMFQEVKQRKLRKYDHWKRRGDSLVLATIEGEVSGRGRRGRRRQEWISNIIEWRGGIETARKTAVERNAHGPTRTSDMFRVILLFVYC